MTARTLEEIGADLGGWNLYPDRQNALDLLAIAQEQRAEIARLKKQIADDNELAKKTFGY